VLGKETKKSVEEKKSEREEEMATDSAAVNSYQVESPKLFGEGVDYTMFSDENPNACVIH